MVSEMWDLVNETDRAAHDQWNSVNINTPDLHAKLIDIIASVEAQKIPLKCSLCPICQDSAVSYNSSSPKVFQEHSTRKHNADFTLTIDLMVFMLSQILKRDITLHSRTGNERFIRTPVPICYHPHRRSCAPSGQSARFHMATEHKADPVPDLGIWDLFVAHVQAGTAADAAVQDMIGEHPIFICDKCSFASGYDWRTPDSHLRYMIGEQTARPKLQIWRSERRTGDNVSENGNWGSRRWPRRTKFGE
jgi:hypothetical protein